MTVRGSRKYNDSAPEGWSAKFSKEAGKENAIGCYCSHQAQKMMTRYNS